MCSFHEEQMCKSRRECFPCRTDLGWRRWLLKMGKVNDENFECIPLGLPIGAALKDLPEESRGYAEARKRHQEAMSRAPRTLAVLRSIMPKDHLSLLDELAFVIFPNGTPEVCMFMQLTGKRIRNKRCGCVAYEIKCDNSANDTRGLSLTVLGCIREKCVFFTPLELGDNSNVKEI
jgi:hypothetical protein